MKKEMNDFLESIPATTSHIEDDAELKKLAYEIKDLEKTLDNKRDYFRRACLKVIEEKNIVTPNYSFDKADLCSGEVRFIFKFDVADQYATNLKDYLMKEINVQRPKSIHFSNLNDLNSAKFLTDDEKREILGLSPRANTNK